MKVLIDIPSNYKERLDKDFDNINTGSIGATSILMAVKEGIEIPDNATNGDMIMALFPNNEIEMREGVVLVHGLGVDVGWKQFLKDWWNTPYKREV